MTPTPTPTPTSADPAAGDPVDHDLARLAHELGVSTSYWDQSGQQRYTAAATVRSILAALGVDASGPGQVTAALADLTDQPWRRTLPPVVVVRSGRIASVAVHVPHGSGVSVRVQLEDGGIRHDVVQVDRWVEPRVMDGRLVGEATFAVPGDLPLGWHRLHAELDGGDAASCALVVTPARLEEPPDSTRWGFMTQLYSLRSRRSWGIGDLGDLADLASWSGRELGAGFVLVNPLQAASPVPPMAPSPYLPVTRRFVNPMYLRVEAIPEYAYLDADDRAAVDGLAAPLQAASRSTDLLDRDASWVAKHDALQRVFAVPMSVGRRTSFTAYVEEQGVGLRDYATWAALVEEYGIKRADWPSGLSDPRSSAVAAERQRLLPTVEFHCWLQWQLDEQLGTAQRAARGAGMTAGIVHDLAVGGHPDGADAWALADVLAADVSVGAPPDMYNQQGQDWSQPPWRPDALAEAAYLPYRDMLRTILRNAGGLRIDHVLGLFRLWWVPRGKPAWQGTYVSYDHEALLGILCLEAQRAGAVIVGEDLGTVEPWVRDVLADRGILGTSILWFERWDSGEPKTPDHWRQLCMGSVTVHDLPPTAGYLQLEHVRIRAELGVLTRPLAEEQTAAAAEVADWLEVLRRERLIEADGTPAVGDVVTALHQLLSRAPCRLLGVGLPDAVGEIRTQNQPGTDQEYPNWRIPLCDAQGAAVLLDDLPGVPLLRRLVDVLRT